MQSIAGQVFARYAWILTSFPLVLPSDCRLLPASVPYSSIIQNVCWSCFCFRENYARRDAHVERNVFATTQAGVSVPTDWNNALDVLAYGSPEQVQE